MKAVISVYDGATHTYCYRRGRVVTRSAAAEPTWRYSFRFGDALLRGECIAPTRAAALEQVEAEVQTHHGQLVEMHQVV